MIFIRKNEKLKKLFNTFILTFLISFSILLIFINTTFIGSTKFQMETTQIPFDDVGITNNLGVSQYHSCQDNAQICSDETGGAFVTWDDDRNDYCDIYAQRVSSSGDVQWATNGLAICTADEEQTDPQIVSDGVGNAIITWLDNRDLYLGTSYLNIYAQKVNSNGVAQWSPNGNPICVGGGSKVDSQICSDSIGGAIITWIDYRSGNSSVYAQKVNSNGDLQWTSSGVPICIGTEYIGTIQICSDGDDGAIVTWQDERSGNRDIYAQRVNSSGDVLWTTNGVAICTANDYQGYPKLCSDGMNGAIITWRDQRSGPSHIYAQRINSSGNVQWTPNGEVISIASDVQTDQQICSDGLNGAFITWYTWVIDYSEESDVYAQRINSSGDAQWVTNGVAISTADNRQVEPQISKLGVGNAIIMWLDTRHSTDYFGYDIYAQCINSTGSVKWTTDGVPICTESSPQLKPRVCSDGPNGAIIVWQTDNYVIRNIYAQKVNSIGDVQWTANGVAICTYGDGISNPIPGYNLLFLLGILSVVAILIIRKIRKS